MVIARFNFQLDENYNVILVDVFYKKSIFKFLLDTGASNSVIDVNELLIAGFSVNDIVQEVKIETANGIVNADIFRLDELKSMGIQKRDFEITAYDFLKSGIISEFDGVLGLDFFENHKICIDFTNFEITIS